jgi:ankyrin repeat protein
MLWTGTNQRKSLRIALNAGEEDECINIYVAVNKDGTSLLTELDPSEILPSKKQSEDTSLHLASRKAMIKLIPMFLEHGGNPNRVNGNGETSLHAVCQGQDTQMHAL